MIDSQSTTENQEIEEWRDVVGYEGVYSVSTLMQIRRDKPAHGTHPGKILKQKSNNKGYPTVALSNEGVAKCFPVHKLPARAFLGATPPGKEINHIDSNPWTPSVWNLEFLTHHENMLHAARQGRMASGERHGSKTHPERFVRGERHGRCKLKESDVFEVVSLVDSGLSHGKVAEKKRVSRALVGRIVNGLTWSWLTGIVPKASRTSAQTPE